MPTQLSAPAREALERFASESAAFCALVEAHEEFAPSDFLQRVHTLLPRLYSAGLDLPSTDILADFYEQQSETEPVGSDRTRGHDEWSALYQALLSKLGERDSYREIFDPYSSATDEEVRGSLADDIADMFFDLRLGLRLWNSNEPEDALFEWRFGLETHWGEHLTGALRALHAAADMHDAGWPDQSRRPPHKR